MPPNGNQEEQDARNAGQNKTADQGGDPCPKVVPTTASTPQAPQSPPSRGPTNNDASNWRGNLKLGIEIVGLLVLITYTWFACLQWLQIRWTNRLTREALDSNSGTLQRTLDKMQGQIEATNRLYTEAQRQTRQDTIMASNSGTQATASKQSAHAAESAANTAVNTLHVTERAYIAIDEPAINVQQKIITLPVFNVGHIASGAVEVLVHQAVANVTDALAPVPASNASGTWQKHRFQSLTPGKHLSILVPFAMMRAEDLNTGHQAIYIAGTVTANDGFSDTPPERSTFCFSTKLIPVFGHVELAPCDAASLLPLMEKIDGYPNNESK